MLKVENLQFQYSQGKSVFHFPDIQLNQDEDLLILGKSGIGKTTMLHLLAGLLTPKEGDLTVEETKINTLSSRKLDAFRGQTIGMIFQKNHAIQSLSIVQNLEARLFFSNQNAKKSNINDILKELDLWEHRFKKPKQLSEGQRQRLGIAMGVIHEPKLILADEPTSSLDDENCKNVINLLKQQARKSKANLVVITHDYRVKSNFENSITL